MMNDVNINILDCTLESRRIKKGGRAGLCMWMKNAERRSEEKG